MADRFLLATEFLLKKQKENIQNKKILTDHGEIHFCISRWRFFKIHPTPIYPAILIFNIFYHKASGIVAGLEKGSTR